MRALLKANAVFLTLVAIFMIAKPQYRIVIEPSSPVAVTSPEPSSQIKNLIGVATWYDASKNNAWYTRKSGGSASNQDPGPYDFYAAAGPAMREVKDWKWNTKPYPVLVTSQLTGRTVLVWVVDWCDCSEGKKEKLIDLAPVVWDALGVNLSRGVMKVDITFIEVNE